jgi:peptidyl-prolyl cis-trans isomerase B (cyclophilin B)
MTERSTRRPFGALTWLALAGLASGGILGCGQSNPPAKVDGGEKPEAKAVASVVAPAPALSVAGAPGARPQTSSPPPPTPQGAEFDRLHQSFLQATRKLPPPDRRPPDRTMTGKSVGKLYDAVVRLWDRIRFLKADGTRIQYTAILQTDLGEIEITLDPELAPNHVRNFIALSKVGYYDGLVFDRIHQEDGAMEDGKPLHFEEIEAGCPLGTGDEASNSIGYWLLPEISPQTTHDVGTIGACHGIDQATAACKFYITLCKAPYLNRSYTAFGKVSRGLAIARKIFLQPVILDDEDVNGSRHPLKPVVIKKVVIHSREIPPSKEPVSRR